jgi:hypothetical protein
MEDPLGVHKGHLSLMYTDPPISTHASLCACGREKDAEAAARRVPFVSVTSLSGHLLCLMTVEHYQ